MADIVACRTRCQKLGAYEDDREPKRGELTMRGRLFTLALITLLLTLGQPLAEGAEGDEGQPLEIGSRLELFVDDYLIESMDGLRFQLQKPQSGGKVLSFDKPWEGTTSLYQTVFKDGDIYRMLLPRQQPRRLYLPLATETRRGTDPRARTGRLLRREQGRNPLDASLPGADRVRRVQGQQHRLDWQPEWRSQLRPLQGRESGCPGLPAL